MKDREDHLAVMAQVTEQEQVESKTSVKDSPDAGQEKTAFRFPRHCGDCEPGGFGSTYGFSSR